MNYSFEANIYYLVIIDMVIANVTAWTGYGKKLNKRYTVIGKFLPITRGWTLFYLFWTFWLGWSLARLGII